jgi:uncharacterized membrane protein
MGIASFNFQSAVVLYYRKNKCLDGLSLRFSEVIETYKRIGSIIVLQILLLYLYFVGIAFFVLPGLIFMSMYSLAMPIMVYDNIGIRSAIKGSGAMTKGYRLKIFLLLLTISILVIIPTYFLRIIGNSISEKIVGSSSDMIISLIVGIITTPFISLAIALIFLELKTNNQLVEQATGLTAE